MAGRISVIVSDGVLRLDGYYTAAARAGAETGYPGRDEHPALARRRGHGCRYLSQDRGVCRSEEKSGWRWTSGLTEEELALKNKVGMTHWNSCLL